MLFGCWFSYRSNCSHWSLTLTFILTSENLSLHTTITLTGPLYNSWHLDSNYCRTRYRQSQLRFVLSPLLLHPRLLGTFQSGIPLFTLTWPAKHSPNQGWESTHRLHLYPLCGVFYSPKLRALGRRDLDFMSHPVTLHLIKNLVLRMIYQNGHFGVMILGFASCFLLDVNILVTFNRSFSSQVHGYIITLKFRYWFVNENSLTVRPLIDWARYKVVSRTNHRKFSLIWSSICLCIKFVILLGNG